MHIIPQVPFDREPDIKELLQGFDGEKLLPILKRLLGDSAHIEDVNGRCVLCDSENCNSTVKTKRIPLTVQLETVGYLVGQDDELSRRIAPLVELLLYGSMRYLMASDLHLEAVHEDYALLQKEHEALIASENRYKDLASSLKQRVKEQVSIIEASQRKLYETEKMASVGQLAAGMAHEINNPIGFINSNLSTANNYVREITGFLETVKNSVDYSQIESAWREADLDFLLEDFNVLLKESMDGAARVARIVADLKDFSNVDRTEETIADINQIIKSVCNVAGSQIGGRINLEIQLNALPGTCCRPGHLGQVLMNMLLNGSQAIKARAEQGDQGSIRISSGVEKNEIVIRIQDDGCGIAPDKINRIFDPFYTTMDIGAGTGLGLTVSRDIVLAHGGRIDVNSEEHKGTEFSIYLPIRN